MDHRKALIKFVQLKNKIIEEYAGLNYVNKKDIDGIKKWNKQDCKRVYDQLQYEINVCEQEGLAEATCIWCIKYVVGHNRDGSYAMHHGRCGNENSLYRRYDTKEVINLLSNNVYKEIFKKALKYHG